MSTDPGEPGLCGLLAHDNGSELAVVSHKHHLASTLHDRDQALRLSGLGGLIDQHLREERKDKERKMRKKKRRRKERDEGRKKRRARAHVSERDVQSTKPWYHGSKR